MLEDKDDGICTKTECDFYTAYRDDENPFYLGKCRARWDTPKEYIPKDCPCMTFK